MKTTVEPMGVARAVESTMCRGGVVGYGWKFDLGFGSVVWRWWRQEEELHGAACACTCDSAHSGHSGPVQWYHLVTLTCWIMSSAPQYHNRAL